MGARLDWARDGADWPHRDASRFLVAGGLRWHVQRMGQGPCLVLLHGTGASTHSFAALLPLLAKDFDVVAPDLPGHGFTDPLPSARPRLEAMAHAVGRLLDTLGVKPFAFVGHSAGAAIVLRLVLDRPFQAGGIISLNGALQPFSGLAAHVFPALARMLFLNPFAAPIAARLARDPHAVGRIISGTGSQLDARGLALYGRLFRNEAHVAATISMMAHWDLRPLLRDLPQLKTPLHLVVGANDKAVPLAVAETVQRLLPDARITTIAGAGHLAHEEKPNEVAAVIRAALRIAEERS